jgi:DNA anti-recombination protein RmuC
LLAAWWKQLVAFCAGLTAFGVVAYAVASQFFLPREDFGAFSDTLKKVEAKMETIHTSMDEMQTSLQANTKAVQRFDRIVAAEGLSEDAAIESRRKQRAAKRAGQ